jgi:single-strand DNA-binding protein
MAGVNRVTLVGRLGQDPEVRYTAAGKRVTTLSVATSERWTDQGGEKREHTEWHKVVMWARLAEIAEQYLEKGAQVYLEGKLRTRKWEDANGQTRYSTEIVADELQMLGSRQSASSPTNHARRAPAPSAEQRQASQDFQSPASGGCDDDIPFAPVPYL